MTTTNVCRSCKHTPLTPVLSLGDQFVSDFLPTRELALSGRRCPIELDFCPSCTLTQAHHTPPPDELYRKQYWYKSGTTDTMRAALKDVVESAVEFIHGDVDAAGYRTGLQTDDMVLDIGSNDGTLLRCYDELRYGGVVKVGIEPASNLSQHYAGDDDPHLWADFWGNPGLADVVLQHHGKAKVVTAIGMFYDLDDPNPFVADVAKILHPDGVFVFQLMGTHGTCLLGDVGNLAHEHLEFYTLKSLQILLSRHGLRIVNIQANTVNGHSYRVFARHHARPEPASMKLMQHVLGEERLGYGGPGPWAQFLKKAQGERDHCVDFVHHEVRKGKTVWVYGASTKGNVILQYYGLNHKVIFGAADRDPSKWGTFTAGTGIEIHSEEYARLQTPDYFLVLPYAFKSEFVAREADQPWRKRGGKFLFPLPTFEVV